jgi:hypothetical protein
MALVAVESSSVQPPAQSNFVNTVCLPFLQAAQNEDGGWGFRPRSQSRVEPTSWVLLALTGRESATEMLRAGFRFLRATQLPDGSWPSAPTQNVGCWATSLAAWALLSDPESRTAVSAGLQWICEDWPRDSSFVWRMIRKLASRERASHNDSLRGWGWTPRTASWVEPTAFALIALSEARNELLRSRASEAANEPLLNNASRAANERLRGGAIEAPNKLLPSLSKKRRALAKLLIYDRMCPGGGWDCGDPMVYGVPGDPLVEPTVWALLALRDQPDDERKALSLQWLEKNLSRTSGPGSLALAKICLEAYGRAWPSDAAGIISRYETNEFLGNVPVMAWVCLALSRRSGWLKAKCEASANAST